MTDSEIILQLSDSETMLLTIIGEARGEPIEGQIAVANVIVNRSIKRKLRIKNVCLQPKQFSCWNSNDPNYTTLIDIAKKLIEGPYIIPDEFQQIGWVVEGIIGKKIKDNTKGRDHYLTTSLYRSDKRPSWAKLSTNSPIQVGNHTFLFA